MATQSWIGHETFRALLEGSYFDVLVKDCSVCKKRTSTSSSSQEKCHNFFCLDCVEAGLCKASFLDGGNHPHHRNIKIHKVAHENALLVNDVVNQGLLALQHTARIKQYATNDKFHLKFVRTSSRPLNTATLQECAACKEAISGSLYTNPSSSPVCSLRCFLDQELKELFLSLLRPAIDFLGDSLEEVKDDEEDEEDEDDEDGE